MDPNLSFFLTMAIIFAIFYFLLIRPQNERLKKHREMVEAVRRGDTVVTAGGLVGKVSKVMDEREVLVEIAENVKVRVLKQTLSDVTAKGEPVAGEDKTVTKEKA